MKRFFPSSVMLTPFVVKHYSDKDQDDKHVKVDANSPSRSEEEKKNHIKKKQ